MHSSLLVKRKPPNQWEIVEILTGEVTQLSKRAFSVPHSGSALLFQVKPRQFSYFLYCSVLTPTATACSNNLSKTNYAVTSDHRRLILIFEKD